MLLRVGQSPYLGLEEVLDPAHPGHVHVDAGEAREGAQAAVHGQLAVASLLEDQQELAKVKEN